MPIAHPLADRAARPGADTVVAPAELDSRDLRDAALAQSCEDGMPPQIGAGALLRFRSLMGAEGLPCDLARLCDDRFYAYERIAAAHATANEPLRRLALELFQIYHRRGIDGPPRQ